MSFSQMKGLSVGPAHLSNQQSAKAEVQSGKVPGLQSSNSVAALPKEECSVVRGEEAQRQLGLSRSVQSVSFPQSQVTVALDAKPKQTNPALSISINQAKLKEEKDLDTSGGHLPAVSTLKPKEDVDAVRAAGDLKAGQSTAYAPHSGRISGMPPVETLPGLGQTTNDYERVSAPDKIPTGKQSESSMPRVRGQVEMDRSYGGDNKLPQTAAARDAGTVPVSNDYNTKHNGQSYSSGGGTMLFVGELHWWTTDVELETALLEFGALKNLKFFEERASGKSKGYCQVEFYDHSAALACKEGMNGRKFHGRPCLVAFASPRTIVQMGTAQVEKAQAQVRAQQAQVQARRAMNDTSGSNRGTSSYQGGDNNRSYGGRSATGAGKGGHGQSTSGRGPSRGRANMGNKGLSGNGGNVSGVSPYGQGLVGPMGNHPSGMMMPQAMMGQGYDPGYGPPRGGSGYGGYVLPGPPFTGMVQPFPAMGPGTLPAVAPHVNPAFFGRNSTGNGMGMMGGTGMDGSQSAMWGDGNMSGWGGDDHDRRGREASYDDDAADSDYTYSNELAYEKSRGAEELNRADAEWPDRRRHRDREGYRDQREREREGDKDDWEREKPWRMRNKGRAMAEEDEDSRIRSREEEYGKRRRLGNER
ncbi:hypothetical protein KP509_18G063400 [Ceratopteris richardii]|nr:hypothetical protein KP509_18G063400 [Ceratopteris richardii]